MAEKVTILPQVRLESPSSNLVKHLVKQVQMAAIPLRKTGALVNCIVSVVLACLFLANGLLATLEEKCVIAFRGIGDLLLNLSFQTVSVHPFVLHAFARLADTYACVRPSEANLH